MRAPKSLHRYVSFVSIFHTICLDEPCDEEKTDCLSIDVIARQLAHVCVRARLNRQKLAGGFEVVSRSRHCLHGCPRRVGIGCELVDGTPYSLSGCERENICVESVEHDRIENLEDDVHLGECLGAVATSLFVKSCFANPGFSLHEYDGGSRDRKQSTEMR